MKCMCSTHDIAEVINLDDVRPGSDVVLLAADVIIK